MKTVAGIMRADGNVVGWIQGGRKADEGRKKVTVVAKTQPLSLK
jgi:hypothetical protein